MIAINDIRSRICRDRLFNVYEEAGKRFIASRSKYPSGDFITAYMVEVQGRPMLSDEGATLEMLEAAGVELTDRREQLITSMIAIDGLNWDGAVLHRQYSPETLGEDFGAFCDALTRISALLYDGRDSGKEALVARVDHTLRTEMPRQIKVTHNHRYKLIDKRGRYTVDWLVSGAEKYGKKHVFAVGGAVKAYKTVATVTTLKLLQLDRPTLCIVPNVAVLDAQYAGSLHDVSDRILTVDQQDDIRGWVLSVKGAA